LFDLKALIESVKLSGTAIAVFVSREVFETDAWRFLKFARTDLAEGDERGHVNALSNSKRAVENRVDVLLYGYGMRGHATRERWNYPTKAERLREAGVFVPEALRNLITSSRNELEHDYRIPKEGSDVADCVDVAQLFLQATDPLVKRGFLRLIVGPAELGTRLDLTTTRVMELPDEARSIVFDHATRRIATTSSKLTSAASFSEYSASEIGSLFRIVSASIEPGKTIVLGPMTESLFVSSFL
jgi:hypothetical protein